MGVGGARSVSQEYGVTAKMVHDLWQPGKLSHDAARQALLASRCMGADKMYGLVDWVDRQEQKRQIASSSQVLKEQLEGTLGAFRSHPNILAWQKQYSPEIKSQTLRFKPLLLQGQSQSGKTRKAISLFGHARTLIVNCQGLKEHLPSLRDFDSERHSCILFDEVSSRQVLANKMVFQGGVDPVTLSQSACNAHSYDVWLHGVPMVLCSNDFQMEDRLGQPMSEDELDWLCANIVDASLPSGVTWFFEQESPVLPVQDEEDEDMQNPFLEWDTE